MNPEQNKVTRRDWLKTVAAAGIGSLLAGRAGAVDAMAGASPKAAGRVPTRPFGKTGVEVPILAVGGMFDIGRNQLLMRQASDWGATYWDTADCYNFGGSTETGIGKYLGTHPEARQQIFLATKSDARDPAGMTSLLQRSLERLKTDVVDLYLIHGVRDINELTDDTRTWVQRTRKEGKIRFFGFSSHSNMAECLLGASKLGWIDGIIFSYNYRIMHHDDMQKAVDACARAGIGLTAMKTQGGGQVRVDSPKELELAGRFMQKGFTDGQAKLKAVWEDERIACICSQMPSLGILMANVAAAMDRTKLDTADLELLRQYAAETSCGYCAGCSNICSAAVGGQVPVSDVMRCLMYHRSYNDPKLARSQFASLPAAARVQLARLDYALAEQRCPQGLPIGRLMKEAAELLT